MKKFEKQSLILLIILIFAIVISLLMATRQYYMEMDEKLFDERKSHLIEFADKVSEVIDGVTQSAWNEMWACSYVLENQNFTDADQLLVKLTDMDDFLCQSDAVLFALDDSGTYYSSDGHVGQWESSNLLSADSPQIQEVVVQIPYAQDENHFFFLYRLDQPQLLGDSGVRVTHLAVAHSVESMHTQLSVSGFGSECYPYIVDPDGRRLYQYTYEDNFIEDDNVLKSISGYEVLNGGSYETLLSAIQDGQSTALEFLYTPENSDSTEKWFVANANVTATGWQVLLFVPSDVLGASTDVLLQETSHFFIGVAAVGAIVIVLCSFVVLRSRADKRLLKQQEASNKLLAAAAQRAEQANQAKSAFLSRMSHDIRTPINGIMGMTAIANKHTNDPARIQDCLNKIDSSSQHLLSLVNDVLDMSRIESGKTSLSLGPFDLRTCLENCASIMEGQLTNRQITLVRTFDEFPQPHVIGDELHLRQVMINILGNAVKFTLDGGSIYFRAWQKDDEQNIYHFEIEDTGIGMKEEYIPHIFEAFTQEETGSRSTYRGTGLGMAITKSFVDLMGGTIWVESTLNVGSTFFVELPLEPDLEANSASAVPDENYDITGMKVLLVEDNELNLEIAREILEEQGVSVTMAENGQEAVERFMDAEPGTFEAILMDVMMPVMDGLTATAVIRASGRGDAATVPILAMTANAFAEDIQKTREAGMNAHLSKPIQPDVLFATLSKYKKRTAGLGTSV